MLGQNPPIICLLQIEALHLPNRISEIKIMFRIFTICLLVSFSIGCSSLKSKVTGANITEVGIYMADITETNEDSNVASQIRNVIDNQKLVRETTRIPAKKGIRFGFRYTIEGEPEGETIYLDMKHKHPPIKAPEQATPSTESTYRLKSWIGRTYTSFLMEEDWEVVTGDWIIQIWHNGIMLLEQKFTTYEEQM